MINSRNRFIGITCRLVDQGWKIVFEKKFYVNCYAVAVIKVEQF